MSKIVTVPIDKIVANPFRALETFPPIENKVAALMRSISDVGLWESVIARPHNGKFQLAFGHQRLEACRRLQLTSVTVIERALTDKQMLEFMGRENGEDYAADFLVMLNTWEAALDYLMLYHTSDKKLEAIDVAKLLGWTRDVKTGTIIDNLASACHGAHQLISDGLLVRADLDRLPVSHVLQIVNRTVNKLEAIDASAKASKAPAAAVKAAKKNYAEGAKETARELRKGGVAKKDIRARVDVNAYKAAGKTKTKDSPLFAVFVQSVSSTLRKLLVEDAVAEKLEEVVKALEDLTSDSDKALLRQLDFDLSEIGPRAETWRKRLTQDKVRTLKTIS